jgi:hypothetical protein
MNDKQIRVAVREKVFCRYLAEPGAFVLEELGVRHGAARVDFALVNGFLHGFELKSNRDNLSRLPHQALMYNMVFDQMTLVVGDRHAAEALTIIPDWWGVSGFSVDNESQILFTELREPQLNLTVDKASVVKLLWKNEVLEILAEVGADKGMRSKSRKQMYGKLLECAGLDFIRAKTRRCLALRKAGRFDERRMSGDG